jgi:ADP-heptose:LPS heptosyltransferase
VVDELAARGLPVIVTHSASEAELARCVAGQHGTIAPVLDVGELAALLRKAAVLVTNNTGPAHLAAAVGTPVVDLYAQTNPQHTPWMVASRVLTRDVPCGHCSSSICSMPGHPCLDAIPPAEVVAATIELLKQRGSRSC